ncbi:MAG: hypothetical protein JOZ41_20940 [Chloroflexi bacterium]|nr:hypothetical protein [Chloroflexota bacterium]
MNYRNLALIVSVLTGARTVLLQYRRLLNVSPERRRRQMLLSAGGSLAFLAVDALLRRRASWFRFEVQRIFLVIASFGVFFYGAIQALTMRREEEM